MDCVMIRRRLGVETAVAVRCVGDPGFGEQKYPTHMSCYKGSLLAAFPGQACVCWQEAALFIAPPFAQAVG